jgi:hypothetical protein
LPDVSAIGLDSSMSKLNVQTPSQNPSQSPIDPYSVVVSVDSPFDLSESNISIKVNISIEDSNSVGKLRLAGQENQNRSPHDANAVLRSALKKRNPSQEIPGQTNSSTRNCLGLDSPYGLDQRFTGSFKKTE